MPKFDAGRGRSLERLHKQSSLYARWIVGRLSLRRFMKSKGPEQILGAELILNDACQINRSSQGGIVNED